MTTRTRVLSALLLASGLSACQGQPDAKAFADPAEQRVALTGNFPVAPPTEAAPAQAAPAAPVAAAPAAPALDLVALGLVPPKSGPDTYAAGRTIFTTTCAACHQAGGQGVPMAIPPLAGSDFATGEKLKVIGVLVNGLSGPVTVKGASYNSMMPKQAQLSENDVANVLTFVRNNLGNHVGDAVTAAEVKAVMAGGAAVR